MKNGVAGGTIICSTEDSVIEILNRLFSDDMEYKIKQKKWSNRILFIKRETYRFCH